MNEGAPAWGSAPWPPFADLRRGPIRSFSPMPKRFDVFLSHNSQDKPAVRALAEALRERGLTVWLDEEDLLPGDPWQEVLEEVLQTCPAAAVLVGPSGLGPWQAPEVRVSLDQFVRRRARVLPVLLPGTPGKPELPPFLSAFTWSDLRNGLTPKALDRLVAGIRGPENGDGSNPLALYRSWAGERYSGLSLIGLGGGDLGRLRFEEVYVPLRIVRRREAMEGLDHEAKLLGRGPESDELGIESLFITPGASNPHSLLLGDPGAGKTTGLLKLLQLCLAQKGERLQGLDPGTLPVFVRLRRFTPADLDRPFAEFLHRELERELGEVVKESFPADLGARLWEHGRLLLLLDGLDEIADPGFRAQVCQLLDWETSDLPHLRAVLSCRFSGYGAKVRLGDRFAPLEVRPLNDEQCRELVRHWFGAAQRALPGRLSKQEALQATDGLLTALESPGYGSQRWKVLVGSPLLLTLLCVIAYRGGQMPRHRTAFYDQCLRVLLGPWSTGRRKDLGAPGGAAPLDVETALAVLRAVAWELHRRGTWDDLSVPELSVILSDCLAPLGLEVPTRQALEWLYRDAGVLTDYGEHRYGLLHLGLQEYLTACHVASQGPALLDEICTHVGEEWWQEVFLLLAGLPGHGAFGPLLTRLLASPALLGQADLLRACLEEAAQPDLAPFVEALAPGVPAERQAAVLRLVRGRNGPRLEESVRALLTSSDPDVRALAGQIAGELAAQRGTVSSQEEMVFVVHHPEDREAGRELADALRRQGWPATASSEETSWRADPDPLVRNARCVVLLVRGGASLPWAERDLASCLRLFAKHRRPVVLAELSGSRPALPAYVRVTARVDLHNGISAAAVAELNHALSGVPAAEFERAALPGAQEVLREPLVEPLTGIRFVWIPGGRFEMGGPGEYEGKPIHGVRISPFWLGETPVTNAQYAVFQEKTRAKEPQYWRNRRFSSPEQPVVGVSWDDAQAFCRWLGKAWGRSVLLPSDAQWEFAARGPEGREYPWGNEPPDASRACFDLDWEKDQPAAVGSYPAGRGPFGTLDQAGNVWEWCRDAWDEKASAKRAAMGGEPLDPVVEGDGSERVVRGGGWSNPAEYLRSAIRSRLPARDRYDEIGFRVAVAPASP